MNIHFNRVILHNFLSYNHSEIDLTEKGYCLVSGTNNCSKDNAVSNGAGKSSWISAICWCLTGETIQGIKSDIKNIYIDEDSCYVELDFSVDNNDYKVIRYNKPKSDLKIIINNKDVSGKGIRESELILGEHLPDVNKTLLSNVILLGQGLPNKLSAHTPSGRKELLEKLSKSDFMIEDIKSRIAKRQTDLNVKLRHYENDLIALNTELNINNFKKSEIENKINNLLNVDYEKKLEDLSSEIKKYEDDINSYESSTNEYKLELDSSTKRLDDLKFELNSELEFELNKFKESEMVLVENKTKLKSDIEHLKSEIKKIDDIQDVCPVCKRPFENVIKPDSTELKVKLNELQLNEKEYNTKLDNCREKHNEFVKLINSDYKEDISKEEGNISQYKKVIEDNEKHLKELQNLMMDCKVRKSVIESELKSLNNQTSSLKEDLNNIIDKINDNNKNIENTVKLSTELNLHIETIKKMDTLVKRDFRGYLLSNVIEYINKMMKEYSIDVFGSDEIEFVLSGNDIDISYCGKVFESLSGGEKQKVDLILQFTIRDMMSKYLNFSSNILCLDEIFDNLDTQSTNNVLNMISKRLNDIESVFIISHHSDELQIPMDTELKIIKNEKGISEVN